MQNFELCGVWRVYCGPGLLIALCFVWYCSPSKCCCMCPACLHEVYSLARRGLCFRVERVKGVWERERESPLIERHWSIEALMSMFVRSHQRNHSCARLQQKPTNEPRKTPSSAILGSHPGPWAWPSSYVSLICEKKSPNEPCASWCMPRA